MFSLDGRTALVTGAGQNIGRGIARQLARAGAAVAVNDINAERAALVVGEIRADGGSAVPAPFDVGDDDAVRQGIDLVQRELGPIDIVVNNAGIPASGVMGLTPFRDESLDHLDDYIRLNVRGPMVVASAVIPHMRAQRWGRIITIASGAHRGTPIGVSLYSAGKGAGVSFNRSLALEEAASGITVNSVSLGLFDRAEGFGLLPIERVTAGIPVRRLGRADEVGALCVYLASDEAGFLTGQTIELNGGSLTS